MKKFICLILIIVFLAGCDSGDLQAKDFPLPDHFSLPQKTIYSLGEATHGSAEFTLLRQNVFAYLVENHGVRAFCLEADFGEGLSINSMLSDTNWDAYKAVKQFGYWVYQNREMEALLDWIHAYNAAAPEEDQIRFYGFDYPYVEESAAWLSAFLEHAAPELHKKYSDAPFLRLHARTLYRLRSSGASAFAAYVEDAQVLLQDLQKHKAAIMAAASDREFELAIQAATNIAQCLQMCLAKCLNPNDVAAIVILRDQAMAERIAWIAEHEKRYYGRQSIFVTGHNFHVSKTSSEGNDVVMGEHLKNLFQNEYYVMGTVFGQGGFYAARQGLGLRKFTVHDALPLSDFFLDEQAAVFFVDFADADSLFSSPQQMYDIGAVFDAEMRANKETYITTGIPAAFYDALFYFHEVHAFSKQRLRVYPIL